MDISSFSSPDQPRILAELRACSHGFAGIPQETRLIYSALSENNEFNIGGLLNPFHNLVLPKSIARALAQTPSEESSAAEHIYRQACLVTSIDVYLHGKKRRTPLARVERWMNKRGLSFPAFLNVLPKSRAPIFAINKDSFADFIWTTYFKETLSGSSRPAVLNTNFYGMTEGWVEAHQRCRDQRTTTVIDTSNWDFFFCQVPTPFGVMPNTQIVVRYHDAIPVFLPHTTALGGVDLKRHHHALKSSIRYGAFFVCTSEPVHDDLLTLYPELESRSAIIPDMISDIYFPDPAPMDTITGIIRLRRNKETAPTPQRPNFARSKEPTKYVLAVSTLEPRKNFKLLLTAWNAVYQKFDEPPLLVLVANRGWRADQEIEDIRNMVQAGRVAHLANVSSHELRSLYSNAHAVVCPSRNEGFDLSGIEAMRCGTPVIATDIKVHRWVYGDAAVYFDPYDAENCAQALFDALSAPKETGYLGELREKGLKQSHLYTPQVIAPKWYACFEELARKKGKSSVDAHRSFAS